MFHPSSLHAARPGAFGVEAVPNLSVGPFWMDALGRDSPPPCLGSLL